MNGIADLINSRRTKQYLTGKITGVEGIENEEKSMIVDHAVVTYDDIKILISADEMNLLIDERFEERRKSNYNGTSKLKFDSRRNMLRGLINAEVDFIIKDIDQVKMQATASRKEGMDRRKSIEFGSIKKGDKVQARILGVGRSQAIAEVAGYQTFIPIQEIAWGRIYNIKDYISVGDKVDAIVTEKTESDLKLSLKEALVEPYQEYIIEKEYYKEFGEYNGKIRLITPDGIFVELRKGITVLCNYPKWIGFTPTLDKEVNVQIKNLRKNKRQIDGIIVREV